MAKKSRRTAARYSELSKERKKKQRIKPPLPEGSVYEPGPAAIPEPAQTRSAPVRITPAPRHEARQAVAEYSHVKDDLKTVGIITGAMLILLIVLSFVLG